MSARYRLRWFWSKERFKLQCFKNQILRALKLRVRRAKSAMLARQAKRLIPFKTPADGYRYIAKMYQMMALLKEV